MLFSVYYSKPNQRKKKVWEDDGYLFIADQKFVLYDQEGAIVEKAVLFQAKQQCLVSGYEFTLRSKIVQIDAPVEDPKLVARFNGGDATVPEPAKVKIPSAPPLKPNLPPAPFKRAPLLYDLPLHLNLNTPPEPLKRPKRVVSTANLVPHWSGSTNQHILPPPPPPCFGKQAKALPNKQPVFDVCIDSYLLRKMRPHQVAGIEFMYKAVMGHTSDSQQQQGAILADDMGLGKTLQAIGLIWTLLRQSPYTKAAGVIKRALVVCPCSLIENWHNEFKKWLGTERIKTVPILAVKELREHLSAPKIQVFIMGYETLRRTYERLSQDQFGLLICDEAHRLKNNSVMISKAILELNIPKRVLLTGTPIQNNMKEFFNMCNLANPGVLGTIKDFEARFIDPITVSKEPQASVEDRRLGKQQMDLLQKITSPFLLRRTSDVNRVFLKPKHEIEIFCRPGGMQLNLYRKELATHEIKDLLGVKTVAIGTLFLKTIKRLRDICNATSELEIENPKLQVCLDLIMQIQSTTREKIVLVSNLTSILDVLEQKLVGLNCAVMRLDGTTPVSKRQTLVDTFNTCSMEVGSVFLLSSKAGGLGLSLIGASRLILYDLDWNPANDDQATSRIWREGQQRDVFIYRLILAGSVEEKILQRQYKKKMLIQMVRKSDAPKTATTNEDSKEEFGLMHVDSADLYDDNLFINEDSSSFLEADALSAEDVRDLLKIYEGPGCETHDLIECNCQHTEHLASLDAVHLLDKAAEAQHTDLLKRLFLWTAFKADSSHISAIFYKYHASALD